MSSSIICEQCENYTATEVSVFLNGDTEILCDKCMEQGEQFIIDTYPVAD